MFETLHEAAALPAPWWVAAVLVVGAFATASLTAAIGIGGGSLQLGLMASLLPPAIVAPVHTSLQCTLHPTRAWYLRRHIAWRMLVPLGIGSLLGTALGISLWLAFTPAFLTLIMGSYIALLALFGPALGANRLVEGRRSGPAGFVMGIVAATIAGVVPATGPLVATYVRPNVDTPQGFVGTHAAAMATQTLTRIAGLIFVFNFIPWLALILAMILAGQVGTRLGVKWAGRWEAQAFDKVLRLVLLALAGVLLARGMLELGASP